MIEINNLTEVKVDEILIKKAAQIVLNGESAIHRLSVAFVGPSRIKNLNKKYRAKNRVTDVLAFGPDFVEDPRLLCNRDENGGLNEELGEVVICLREVKKNAKRYALSFEKELINCLIHGILHLLGYEHEKSKEKAKAMEEKQDYYLSKICLELKS